MCRCEYFTDKKEPLGDLVIFQHLMFCDKVKSIETKGEVITENIGGSI